MMNDEQSLRIKLSNSQWSQESIEIRWGSSNSWIWQISWCPQKFSLTYGAILSVHTNSWCGMDPSVQRCKTVN